MNNKNQKSETWNLPYANPTAKTSILENEQYFSNEPTLLFENVIHPYNPQYSLNNLNNLKEVDKNMINGQPKQFNNSKFNNYPTKAQLGTQNNNNNPNFGKEDELEILINSEIGDANIYWDRQIDNVHQMEINPNFRALPNGNLNLNYQNPDKTKGKLTNYINHKNLENNPSQIQYLNQRDDNRFFNSPFYNVNKRVIELPYKQLI